MFEGVEPPELQGLIRSLSRALYHIGLAWWLACQPLIPTDRGFAPGWVIPKTAIKKVQIASLLGTYVLG